MLLTTDALAFFDATSSTAWKHHANGLAALIETRGPRIYDTMGLLLHAPMLQLLMDALLWRGPFKFGEEQWLTAMLPTCQTRMNRLLYLGCQVPDVVKRTDKYLSQAQDVQGTTDFDSVMDSITALERNLHDWLSDWYLADFQSKPPYTNTTTTTATARAEALDVGLPSPLHPPPLSGHTNSPSTPATTLTASLQATTSTANSLLCTATFVLRSVVSLPGGLACSAGPLIVAGRWYAFCDREGERQCREWCEEIVEVVIEGGKRPAGWITRSCAAWITAAL
jgi:hypothetical protein